MQEISVRENIGQVALPLRSSAVVDETVNKPMETVTLPRSFNQFENAIGKTSSSSRPTKVGRVEGIFMEQEVQIRSLKFDDDYNDDDDDYGSENRLNGPSSAEAESQYIFASSRPAVLRHDAYVNSSNRDERVDDDDVPIASQVDSNFSRQVMCSA